jgi:hypothetical protein
MLMFVCMHGRYVYIHTGLCVFPSSSIRVQIPHTNMNQMQNVHVVSKPKLYVLSNDALFFGVSLIILCTICILLMRNEETIH